MIRQFLFRNILGYVWFISVNLNMAFGEEYESGTETECNSSVDCHNTNEYCDLYSNKCHQCVDICVTDITKFDECTKNCKNYLRENVVRRLDDIENIYTLVCIIIVITSIILILLFVLLVLKIRGRKRTKSNGNFENTAMQMKKLQELEANQQNGHVIMHSSPKQRMNLAKGTSMQTMTTAISNIDEDDTNSHHPRRRQPSTSTNNGGGSKRSYQSSSAFYDPPPRTTTRKPSEDRVPQCPSPSDNNVAYDNLATSRSPTPTSSNQTLKGTISPNRTTLPPSTRVSPADRGPNSTRLPPIGQPQNGSLRPAPYTISHSQVV